MPYLLEAAIVVIDSSRIAEPFRLSFNEGTKIMLNNYRGTHGASNLTLSPSLQAQAQAQADKMCQTQKIGPIVQGQNINVKYRGDYNPRCPILNQCTYFFKSCFTFS
jgi:hypothetical protein